VPEKGSGVDVVFKIFEHVPAEERSGDELHLYS
jgi:hypothetical protein